MSLERFLAHCDEYEVNATIAKQLFQKEWLGIKVKGGWTLLHICAFGNSPIMAEFLIQQGADVNARGLDNETPLHSVACRSGRMAVAKIFLAYGADTLAKDANGKTPLEVAIAAKNEEMITLLKTPKQTTGAQGASAKQSWWKRLFA